MSAQPPSLFMARFLGFDQQVGRIWRISRKLKVPYWGPMIRTIEFWELYWGLPVLGHDVPPPVIIHNPGVRQCLLLRGHIY